MKRLNLILFLLTFCISVHAASVDNLRCENIVNPLGIDIIKPELSWIMNSEKRGDRQTAYRIIVSSTQLLSDKNKGDVWDSGKMKTDRSIQIEYNGKPLESGKKYYWKVCIWDKDGKQTKWSQTSWWTMGLIDLKDWKNSKWIAFKDEDQWRKEWIEHKEKELENYPSNFTSQSWPWLSGKDSTIFTLYEMAEPKYDPSPLFRKEFNADKKINSAYLYICGLGYYEAFINGERVGDHVLDPAWTNYEQRSMYVTHEVTNMVEEGINTIGVMLGRGQYNPLCNDIWGLYRSAWVDQPKLIALLRIEYTDGTTDYITTDESWKSSGGPIIYDDTRHGEIYDARREQKGWNKTGFNDNNWKNASLVTWNTELVPQMIPPIRKFEAIQPVRTFDRGNGVTIYDIGENIAGWAQVKVSGPAGSKILVEYSETPSDNELVEGLTPWRFRYDIKDSHYASFYDKGVNVRQQNGYILNGNGEEEFECHFSYKGFQFIRITAENGVTIKEVSGIPVHTDVETTGYFICSNPVINQTQKNSVASLLHNYHSIATDCPHREKQGWTADNYMSSQAAMYNFNVQNFYRKWLVDLAGTQNETGGLCTVAPSTGYDMAVSTAWPAALVYLPCDMFAFYGDTRGMKENYEAMYRFAESNLLRQVEGKPEIINEVLGDWLAPIMELNDTVRNNTMAPPEGHLLYGTAAHYLIVKRLSEISRILGKDEADSLKEWSDKIAENFNKEFFDPSKGIYHGDKPTAYRQAANIVPLDYGIVSKENQQDVYNNLIKDINSKGDRLSTGFLGTPALMNYLPERDPELAFKLATQPNYPGWGYMVQKEANAMWESWDGYDSRNHTPFCLISGYFYKHLAGIQYDSCNPGFKHIIINPSVVGDLEFVNCYHDSPYGRIVSNWKIKDNTIEMEITVPANTTATIHIPTSDRFSITESGTSADMINGLNFIGTAAGKAIYSVESGKYNFKANI